MLNNARKTDTLSDVLIVNGILLAVNFISFTYSSLPVLFIIPTIIVNLLGLLLGFNGVKTYKQKAINNTSAVIISVLGSILSCFYIARGIKLIASALSDFNNPEAYSALLSGSIITLLNTVIIAASVILIIKSVRCKSIP